MAWATAADVAALLGPNTGWDSDETLQTMVVDAANAYAFRRRAEAGYLDDPDVSPGPDVTLGTALYAVSLFRERATTDGFASFDDLGGFTPGGGSFPRIKQLLGVGRPMTDGASAADVNPLRTRRWGMVR